MMTTDDRTIPLFPEALAELKKACAGRPYRPSNGTEGDFFVASWCSQCQHSIDENDDIGYDIACEIYHASMIGHVDDWIIDASGQPKCTQFQIKDSNHV